MSAIEIDHLVCRYGERIAVDDLTLRIEPGALFGFLGPNGAGKTTTIRVLVGLIRAAGGRAAVHGSDVWSEGVAVRRQIGYLPGDLRLYPHLRGRELLRIMGRIRGADLHASSEELADRYELDLGERIRRMSRGMRQKLGLIIAMAHDPPTLILDEPTSGLDPLIQERLRGHLLELAERGRTVFFSSHSLAEVEQLCHEVAVLRRGRLVAHESLEAMRSRAARRVVMTWSQPITLDGEQLPEGLKIRSVRGAVVEGSLLGPSGELVRWAAGRGVTDLTIGEPDLEDLFQDYYRSDGPDGAASTSAPGGKS
jgi:ABC-2 type transport system ATP-binding protein